jgi:hypothetical protein
VNPWITGRIVETMQQEARKNGERARLGRHATAHRQPASVAPTEHRRPRVSLGLAVARLGFRIAGRGDEAAITRPAFTSLTIDSSNRNNPWTTCGATSTSTR